MLVAALSSCHMLSFLAICAKKKLTVNPYQDDAVGFLENDGGKLWITRVILQPKVAIDRRRRKRWRKFTIWRTKPASSPIP